ncbi:uncharacterized protein LOC116299846 [Actinia tenebrosa]|uniref:Uncharacterized protein LOC116299846 n=1 Tax=Actinia tenebrosa TaxID=6105 RepID=A0A6P8IB33_ACTTE|nr:uncharacterized protein LOC116299846 [Actinia tenebrosa]
MASRGPDWDFYQCKCGNIVFEYNTITGEKCLTDTWKDCTISCMEPVSYVPPCARPFTTVRIPVSRPQRSLATQTTEGVSTRSVDTQTPPSTCTCNSSTLLPASASDTCPSCDTDHANLSEDKSQSVLTNTTVENEKDLSKEKADVKNDLDNLDVVSNEKDSLVEEKHTSKPSTSSLLMTKDRRANVKKDVKVPTPSKNGYDRILRKRKTDPPVDEKVLGKEPNCTPKNSKRRV